MSTNTLSSVASVAAPVVNAKGRPLCVLSLGFATSQVRQDQMHALGRQVKAAAEDLATRLEKEGVRDAG